MNEIPGGSPSDSSNPESTLESTGQKKHLKLDNKSIKRRRSKKKSKRVTWGDIKNMSVWLLAFSQDEEASLVVLRRSSEPCPPQL